MSEHITATMRKRFQEMAAQLTTEQVQEEFNRRTLHYLWMQRQAQQYSEAELQPFADEIRKRKTA